MIRNHSLGIFAIMAFVPALPALAQMGTGSGHGPRVRPPYTIEFKTSHVQTLANGTTIATETKEVMARDQDQRRMTSTTTMPVGDRPAITNVHVSDPTTGDEINWSSLSKVARDVRRPVGADRRGCWASPDGRNRMSFGGDTPGTGPVANGPLQPPAPIGAASPVASPLASPIAQPDAAPPVTGSVGGGAAVGGTFRVARNMPPGQMHTAVPRHDRNNIANEDLGKDTIMGVDVYGQRTTVTTPAGAEGNDEPLVRTDESWMAPSLGMVLRSVSDDPRMGKSSREVVSLDLSPPDPALFQPPADYKVETEVLQPVPCGQ